MSGQSQHQENSELCQEPGLDQADSLAAREPITSLPGLSFPGMDLSRYRNFVVMILTLVHQTILISHITINISLLSQILLPNLVF